MEYETLLSVIVGAAIGFLTSIGYEWWSESWREGREKKQLTGRIKEELELLQKEITYYYNREMIEQRTFSTEIFQTLKQDLVRRLDATSFRAIQDAYSRIDVLKLPSNVNRTRYGEALSAIDNALRLLNGKRLQQI